VATLATRLPLFLATCIFGATLLGSGAYAAVPATDGMAIAAVPTDLSRTVSEDGRTDRDRAERDHHRRFCVKLNEVLSRLVEQGVITREQKLRIMEAFNCVPDDRPSPTPRPSATRRTAAQ